MFWIPRKLVIQGLEIAFCYTGQPIQCYQCNSAEHILKNCPKRRRNINSTPADCVFAAGGKGDAANSNALPTSNAPSQSYAEATQQLLPDTPLSQCDQLPRKHGPSSPAKDSTVPKKTMAKAARDLTFEQLETLSFINHFTLALCQTDKLKNSKRKW